MLQRKYIIYRESDHEDEQAQEKNGVLPDILERIHREKAVTDTLTHIRTSIQDKVLKDVPNRQELIDNFEKAISDVKDNLFKEKIVREKWWKELKDTLTEIKGLYDTTNTKTLYLHLIFHGIRQLPAKHILNLIKEVLPQAIVTGMTETLFETANGAEYVMISANFFKYSEIKLLQFDGIPTDYAQEGKRMGDMIAAYPHAKAAAVYCSCMDTEFSLFFSNMTQANNNIVFFGASAGTFGKINEITSTSKHLLLLDKLNMQDNQFIAGNHQILSTGIVVAVFCGEELHVQGDYILGWKPLGKELTITEADGINCIAKLDGIPATDIYHHYLWVTPDENFVFNIAEFPLVIERNGCLIARVPPIHDDDGRIYFNGDIYEGEKVRLTYAVPTELLQKTAKNSDKMCDFSPEGLFLTICGNRTMFLHEAADEEIGFYKRFVPQLMTNYGTSEIYFNKGQGG
ncbi:FIST N-terminal domain-containing protein, partial [uncultured Anaerovibrio sp.]|uniref:FIST N-terminal domain-containing protein n=1 Tax=uncultured Anaerovibrio sp. TaxID=361586 RepID=UPI0026136D7A